MNLNVEKIGAEPKKPVKTKSPAVPSYPLEESLEDARKLYRQYSHGSFSRTEIASALSMSSSSSALSTKLFSLLEYGVIQDDRAGYKLTARFHSLNTPTSISVFKRSALDAIRGSWVFAELLDSFKSKLPEQGTLAQRLETQMKFNANRARDVAMILEHSLLFAGILDANHNIIPIRENGIEKVEEAPEPEPEEPVKEKEVVAEKQNLHKIEIPLSNGRMATIWYPYDLTSTEAEKIGKVMKALAE